MVYVFRCLLTIAPLWYPPMPGPQLRIISPLAWIIRSSIRTASKRRARPNTRAVAEIFLVENFRLRHPNRLTRNIPHPHHLLLHHPLNPPGPRDPLSLSV